MHFLKSLRLTDKMIRAESVCPTFLFFSYVFLGFPAVVVAISLAVTQADGYGSQEACWLDVNSGLIWVFIAPVLFVILVSTNFLSLFFNEKKKIK